MEREDLRCSCSLRQCRICHEEEDDFCASMESPCACSGSLKFAHRGCVQRWCDEKGSTLCEICLQNFEPGYNAVPPEKAQVIDVAVTIRGRLEVPWLNYEPEDAPFIGLEAVAGDLDYAECARAAGRSAFLVPVGGGDVVLLLRHLITVATVGAANQYAFSLLTIYLLRASGILLPFYVVMRLISAVQQGQRQYWLQLLQEQRRNASRMIRLQGQEQQQQQHVILLR